MANRARHAFGSSDRIAESIANGVIDSYDILFLDGDTDNPKIGWVSKDGKPIILRDEKADLTDLEADVAALESAMSTKANAEEVDAKIAAAMAEHLTKKYEILNVPTGTLVDYDKNEIRIMAPANAVWSLQNVGTGGDANTYYCTFKTYAPDNAAGYIEHMGSQADKEVLTDLRVDEHGRKYQLTWLGLAKHDESSDSWTYYGASSTESHYIGWDYRIDFYDANNVMVASDCVRINLSNENCHSSTKPYYVGGMMKKFETIVEEKIAEVDSAYQIVEF